MNCYRVEVRETQVVTIVVAAENYKEARELAIQGKGSASEPIQEEPSVIHVHTLEE